jgi:hypothetical protein
MGQIVWTCDTCHEPTHGLGAISITYDDIHRADDVRKAPDFANLSPADVLAQPNLGRWKVECDTCAGECIGAYWIDLRRARTDDDLAEWTQHLNRKTWFAGTNWDAFIESAALSTPRLRVVR